MSELSFFNYLTKLGLSITVVADDIGLRIFNFELQDSGFRELIVALSVKMQPICLDRRLLLFTHIDRNMLFKCTWVGLQSRGADITCRQG